MVYNDLYLIIKKNGYTVKSISEQLDMTSNGFKRGVESQTIQWKAIFKLCSLLGITPNDLLDWPDSGGSVVATNINGGHNEQNSNLAITVLRDQLKELNRMLAEKDKQINRLMAIVENANGGSKSATKTARK